MKSTTDTSQGTTQAPAMTMAEFKMYLRSKHIAKSNHQKPTTWLVVKRDGLKGKPTSIGLAVFRGAILPFKLSVNWRNYGLYLKGGE